MASMVTSAAVSLDRAAAARRPRARRRRRRRHRRRRTSRTAEIFSPPYLFKGARPTIYRFSVDGLTYGGNFTVTTPDAASIASVALIATGSVTHAFNQNQRVHEPLVHADRQRHQRRCAGQRQSRASRTLHAVHRQQQRRAVGRVDWSASRSAAVPCTVAVPNVVDSTQAAATTAITNAGLTVGTITTASSATVPAGSVISQNPAAGTQVATGSAVSLVVSSGPALVTVPNVVNTTQAAATSDHHRRRSRRRRRHHARRARPSPAGSVISQAPIAGTQVTAGSAVGARGVDRVRSRPSSVPNVVDLTSDGRDERHHRRRTHRRHRQLRHRVSTVPAGLVISQIAARRRAGGQRQRRLARRLFRSARGGHHRRHLRLGGRQRHGHDAALRHRGAR